MTPISAAQQELYRAYSHSYATEANRRRITFFVDVLFTLVAAAIAILTVAGQAELALTLLSKWSPPSALLWLVIRETDLLDDDAEHRRTAVTIQEQFDLTFWKPDAWREAWNNLLLGKPVRQRTINDLAIDYEGQPLANDYWVDTSGLPPETSALLRIKQSAAWGANGHRRYARLNRSAAVGGLITVLAFTFITNFGTRETAGLLMAVAPLLTGRLQSSRAHQALADRRGTLEDHIEELLGNGPDSPTDRDVRTAQDELSRMRLEHRRIPAWLYNRYAERDRAAIDSAIAEDAQRLRSQC